MKNIASPKFEPSLWPPSAREVGSETWLGGTATG